MSLLREYVKLILSEGDTIEHDGAGVIVVREFDGEWKILGLEDDEGMDFPKGSAEDDENPMETALRETEEESSLASADLDFKWGKDPLIIDGHLFLYLAATKSEADIQRNPESGKLEHKSAQWLSFDEAEATALHYLKPGVVWAREKVHHNEE
ncbi:NUDIX domain-containing protein [Candidatus Bathyarchaeota archaeon]|jgi:8-oxo-dGTP pyrophosphatase MutT (NUDIX family)|nr:NUDIX domain-containing protein [Candidatus Bathyarchaeota archaeon]